MKKPSLESQISKFRIIYDTREQTPYRFKNSIKKYLPTADYSVEYEGKTYDNKILVERKSDVSELFIATGSGRERWESELSRMKEVEYKWVLCEFHFNSIVNEQPPGLLEPSAVYGSIMGWMIDFKIPFIFAGNRVNSRACVWKLFYQFTKKEILGIK